MAESHNYCSRWNIIIGTKVFFHGILLLLLCHNKANGFSTTIHHTTTTRNASYHHGSHRLRFFALNNDQLSSTTSTSSRRPSRRRGDGSNKYSRNSGGSNARSSSDNISTSVGVGPKAEARQRRNRRSTRTTSDEVLLFDPKKLTSLQLPNEDAIPYDLHSDLSSLKIRIAPTANEIVIDSINNNDDEEGTKDEETLHASDNYRTSKGKTISHPHFRQMSLDDIFPNLNFSKIFHTDGAFREDIRKAMRNDIFYTTPAYANLSPKIASYMLDDDSSLQGSWNCIPKNMRDGDSISVDDIPIRMTRLTTVLKDKLGDEAPTGDEFMMKIGSLCGLNPSNHWIDIIGVKDRVVSHSWHQDTGKSYNDKEGGSSDGSSDGCSDGRSDGCSDGCSDSSSVGENSNTLDHSRYTVMLGFPEEDEYEGTGVFSHAIKLNEEHLAPHNHNDNEPVLFEGVVDEKFVVRPSFLLGKELLIYRDIDTLHSAPDVVYRKSVMRFM